jgi:hypothetical protein
MFGIKGIAYTVFIFALGFGVGIYSLPILTAQDPPNASAISSAASEMSRKGRFVRELKGSDFFHWGEGEIFLTPSALVHKGELAPGPDYKAYLAPSMPIDETSFLAIKDQSLVVGDVKSFKGFILDLPKDADVNRYSAVVIWCETFGEFITSASIN